MNSFFCNHYGHYTARYVSHAMSKVTYMTTHVCRQFMCPIYPLCVLYVFKNGGNNIKRGKNHEHQNDITSSHVHASQEYVSSRFMLLPTFVAKNI